MARRSKNQQTVIDGGARDRSPSLFEMLLTFMALLVVLALILALST